MRPEGISHTSLVLLESNWFILRTFLIKPYSVNRSFRCPADKFQKIDVGRMYWLSNWPASAYICAIQKSIHHPPSIFQVFNTTNSSVQFRYQLRTPKKRPSCKLQKSFCLKWIKVKTRYNSRSSPPPSYEVRNPPPKFVKVFLNHSIYSKFLFSVYSVFRSLQCSASINTFKYHVSCTDGKISSQGKMTQCTNFSPHQWFEL